MRQRETEDQRIETYESDDSESVIEHPPDEPERDETNDFTIYTETLMGFISSINVSPGRLRFRRMLDLYNNGETSIDLFEFPLSYTKDIQRKHDVSLSSVIDINIILCSELFYAILLLVTDAHYVLLGDEFVAEHAPEFITNPISSSVKSMSDIFWIFRRTLDQELGFFNPLFDNLGIDFWQVIEDEHGGRVADYKDVCKWLGELYEPLRYLYLEILNDPDAEE